MIYLPVLLQVKGVFRVQCLIPTHPLELHMVFQSVLTVRNTRPVPGPFEECKFDKHRPKVRIPKQTMTISKRGTSKCQNIANSVAMNTSANGTAGLKWTRLQNQPCEFKVFQSTSSVVDFICFNFWSRILNDFESIKKLDRVAITSL